ncbi:hypothetical protein B0A48_12166 [Cryoendolithus antarcticus]|uniref:DUF6697 domain-containing protein n=1 Tax=Cryoendolithus antarcticus TaxID=1507870 RepID=A0A1V8SUG1_9PEZI|nr:hypothetical protein B0A48_12166 [Cryoendolithus antarcticus]
MSKIPREPNAMRIAPRFVQNINNYLAQDHAAASAAPRIVPAAPAAVEPFHAEPNNTALSRVVTHQASGDIDLARLEERSWQHTSEIDILHDMTANDLRTLQAEIVALRSSQRQLEERVDNNEQRVNTMANTSLTFAIIMEQQAALLRQTAEAALPGISSNAAFVERTKAIEAPPTMKAIKAAPVSAAEAPVWITSKMPEPTVDTTPGCHGTESPSPEVTVSQPAAGETATPTTKPLPPHLRAGKKAASPPVTVAAPAAPRRSHAIEIKKPETQEVVVSPAKLETSTAATIAPVTTETVDTPTIEKPDQTATAAIVQSQAVVNMGAPHPVFEPAPETFTWEFLFKTIGGTQYSPGFNVVPAFSQSASLLGKGRTYWLLDAEYEPFAPTRAGEHGAKLTAFFNDDAVPGGGYLENATDYFNVPVFVATKGGEYTYMGNYSQTRYSDQLSHSETLRLPATVLEYWATQLSDPNRPAWVTEKLRLYFWPRPAYEGPLPPSDMDDNATLTSVAVQAKEQKVERALGDYMTELRSWDKDSRIKVSRLIRKETLMALWHNSDLDEEKGLRLWWEYLECVGDDEKFVKNLIAAKKSAGAVGESVRGRTMVEGRPIGGEAGAVNGKMEMAEAGKKVKQVLKSGGAGPHGSPW